MAKNNNKGFLIGAGLALALLFSKKSNAQSSAGSQNNTSNVFEANLYNAKGEKLPFVASNKTFNESMAKNALLKIKNLYGLEIAQNVERIYRLETNHFRSLQFFRTYTAGMLSFSAKYPYGWTSFKPLWDANTNMAPTGYWATKINNQPFIYLAFPTLESAMFVLAGYLQKYSVGRWNTTNEENAKIYAQKVSAINSTLVS